MFKWLPYPFLRFTPVWIFGILAAYYTSWQFPPYFLAAIALVYTLFLFGIPRKHRFTWHPLLGLTGMLWLFVSAYTFTGYRYTDRQSDLSDLTNLDYTHYVATVVEPAEAKTNSFKSVLKLNYLLKYDSIEGVRTRGMQARVVVYQPKADSTHLFDYGDQVLVKGLPQPVKGPANPHEFDYRRFLSLQHIGHQHYIPQDNWVKKGSHILNPIMDYAYQWREACQNIFRENIGDPQARGIALALVLGIKNELDGDVRAAYAAAGAMHVLAVSGLHVGIIYLVIAFFLKPLERRGQWGKVFKAIVCLLALWSFALLTGMSASVMRAATMFSFIIIASASRRRTNIFNTIAASAFFLLLYDPLLLLSVGFQLSYLAVLGIVYLQPKIYAWFTPKSRWLDWLWGLTAVSIAAQLATFPLGLLYFQQFPVYFWLSNILVIPAAYLILSLGLLSFIVGFAAPALVYYPTWLLEKIIQLVNHGVKGIERLPGSVLQDIYFSSADTLALYLAIVFLLLLLHYRRFRFVWMLSASLLFIAVSRGFHMYRANANSSITFYHVPKQSRIDLSHGRSVIHLGDQDPKAMYHVAANHVQKGARTTFIADSTDFNKLAVHDWQNIKLMVWQGKKIAMVHSRFDHSLQLAKPLEVDLVVLCNNALYSLDNLATYLRYDQLIIDSSNTYYRARKLADEARERKIAYHCVPLQGAYEYHIK